MSDEMKANSDKKLILEVSSSPHLLGSESTARIMWTVSAALMPAAVAAVYFFGLKAFLVILVCIASAVLSEAAMQKIMGRKISLADGSAFLTGLLLAFNLPACIPLWAASLGSIAAIVIAKQLFGGLGSNIFNPALIGRAFLLASWPRLMTTWPVPEPMKSTMASLGLDATTTATPLALIKEGRGDELLRIFGSKSQLYIHLFWGNRSGCLGETAVFLLIIGGLYLIYKRYIDWQVPAAYIGTLGALSWIFGGRTLFQGDILFHMLSGGLMLGAFYMATDMVTIPVTLKGRIIFAVGCGILTILIRLKGGYPEGVCYAILLMNSLTPLLDARIKPDSYGAAR
jgi:Na+-translocating ferredoxin:NAD+ oxidoreductase subunit D